MDEKLHEHYFFDKYIKMNIPNNYNDLSKFHNVPDNQEIYHHEFSESCIIIEIVCHQNIGNKETGLFYFNDLARENESIDTTILINNPNVDHIQRECSIIIGKQCIRKGNSTSYNDVFVHLCVFPYPEHDADIIITWYIPKNETKIEPESTTFYKIIQSFYITDFNLFTPIINKLIHTDSIQ